MKITSDTHADHALTQAHIDFVLARFGDREAFFLETVDLPPELPSLPCALHGPRMGDAPVPEAEVAREVRGSRAGSSRLCGRPTRLVRTMTVIGGPDASGQTILYTAFGGPSALREPWEPGLTDAERAESEVFWAQHALSR